MGHLGSVREDMSLNAIAAHLHQIEVQTIRDGERAAKAVSRIQAWAT